MPPRAQCALPRPSILQSPGLAHFICMSHFLDALQMRREYMGMSHVISPVEGHGSPTWRAGSGVNPLPGGLVGDGVGVFENGKFGFIQPDVEPLVTGSIRVLHMLPLLQVPMSFQYPSGPHCWTRSGSVLQRCAFGGLQGSWGSSVEALVIGRQDAVPLACCMQVSPSTQTSSNDQC
jgi:hypothetical protein